MGLSLRRPLAASPRLSSSVHSEKLSATKSLQARRYSLRHLLPRGRENLALATGSACAWEPGNCTVSIQTLQRFQSTPVTGRSWASSCQPNPSQSGLAVSTLHTPSPSSKLSLAKPRPCTALLHTLKLDFAPSVECCVKKTQKDQFRACLRKVPQDVCSGPRECFKPWCEPK